MAIYANVRPSSRYAGQRQPQPFPICLSENLGDWWDGYIWQGGIGGRYATSDLEFFKQTREGWEPVTLLTGWEPHLISQVADSALSATNVHYLAEMLETLKGATQRLQAAHKAAAIDHQKQLEAESRWD